jgi:DNA-binding transcriptional LysR family regulator
MELEANDLLLFARVVGEGSFSRAALRLGMPKSTLSRRMTALEAQLGERLLLRTTRKLAVTDFGHSMLLHAQQVTSEVEAALALAQHRQVAPSGRLRVSMPADFANIVLAPMLAQFVATYPAISLELDLSPRRVDLIGENFDLAIRMGDLASDASLAARQLAVFSTGLYAAPSYLAKHGMPLEPEALMEHDVLRILARTGEPIPWQLSRADAHWEGTPTGRVTANSPELLMQMTRAGAGITAIGDHFAEPYLRNGELIQLLADWSLPSTTAWAVFPGRRLMPSRTRVFLDAMLTEFSGPNCQEKEAQIKSAKASRAKQK